nr:MAG: putative glycoprotein [Enontekio alphachrysovirus]
MNGDSYIDLSNMWSETINGVMTIKVANKRIELPHRDCTYLTDYEIAELVLKTGTMDDEIRLDNKDVMMLETMDRLRKARRRNLSRVGKPDEPCWVSRHSWHTEEKGVSRCIRLKGECSGSCPNVGWGDPLCFDIRDINPYMSNNHLTGNLEHYNPDSIGESDYKYKISTDDGVKLTLVSKNPFSDDELQMAACEIRKMIIDPIKEEDIILKSNKVKYYTRLPSSESAIKQLGQINEMIRIDKALDNRTYQRVLIKELIPGVQPPCPMQLLQEFPRGGSTSIFDHEFSPLVREPWMEDCGAKISDPYDYSNAEKLCAKVVPNVKYPDLTPMMQKGEIDGDRFCVTYDIHSGVVETIKSKRKKYVVEEGKKRMKINNDVMVTNMVVKNKEGMSKKHVIDNKRRVYIEKKGGIMVPILYSILMISCMLPISNAAYICGDDKHGTLWSMPLTEDCSIDKDTGDTVTAMVYTKEYNYNMTVHRCYRTERVDKTTYGLFGPKSHLGFTIQQIPLSIDECKKLRDRKTYNGDKLQRIGENSWSTAIKPNLKYVWCCQETKTSTVNVHLEETNVRVHLINGYAVMISSDTDISHCSYQTGNYTSPTSVYIWEPIDVNCDIKEMGKGEFTILSDGHLMSYELQLSLMAKGNETYCGVEYISTEQGLLIKELSRNKKRDVDAAEKNFLIKAANEYSKKLYDNNYISLCTLERIVNSYLLDMSRMNPSRFARAYFHRENIAAKFVGGALLVWECKEVEVLEEMRGHRYGGMCYDMMPIKYEYDRDEKIGFLDVTTNEVLPVSSTHDCNSVSGYLIYDQGWRKYRNNTYYENVVSVQRIPSNSAHMEVKEISFINNHLHSVFGPSGSRYRESLANDLVALGAKHLINEGVDCNAELDTRISEMAKDVKESIKHALFLPFKMIIITLLIILAIYLMLKFSCHVLLGSKIKSGYNKVRFIRGHDNVVIEE